MAAYTKTRLHACGTICLRSKSMRVIHLKSIFHSLNFSTQYKFGTYSLCKFDNAGIRCVNRLYGMSNEMQALFY